MKLLLDMYKGVSKDQRDKVQLMATEKKLRSEIEELRNQMKKIQVKLKITNAITEKRIRGSDELQESKREERKKLADEDALRKIKQLEEQKYELQKQVANQKPADGSWPGHYGARPFVGSPVRP